MPNTTARVIKIALNLVPPLTLVINVDNHRLDLQCVRTISASGTDAAAPLPTTISGEVNHLTAHRAETKEYFALRTPGEMCLLGVANVSTRRTGVLMARHLILRIGATPSHVRPVSIVTGLDTLLGSVTDDCN